MSFGPSFDAKEQVRQAVDIVDLVGSYIPLRRQGRNFVGLCRWHDDSRPSLNVNPDRQTWRCWVCDIGGDVFSFIMKAEGLEFREALEMLADRAGIKLQRTSNEPGSPSPRPEDDKHTRLNRVLARLYAKAERFTDAIAIWELVRKEHPEDVEATHALKNLSARETIERGRYKSRTPRRR